MSFDDLKAIVSLVSPTIVVIGAIITAVKWVLKKLEEERMERKRERDAEIATMTDHLNVIEQQVRLTNGTVQTHTKQLGKLEADLLNLGQGEIQ